MSIARAHEEGITPSIALVDESLEEYEYMFEKMSYGLAPFDKADMNSSFSKFCGAAHYKIKDNGILRTHTPEELQYDCAF